MSTSEKVARRYEAGVKKVMAPQQVVARVLGRAYDDLIRADMARSEDAEEKLMDIENMLDEVSPTLANDPEVKAALENLRTALKPRGREIGRAVNALHVVAGKAARNLPLP
jgi:DNA primase large subunit